MATDSKGHNLADSRPAKDEAKQAEKAKESPLNAGDIALRAIKSLASLKLTVALFGMAIVIVWAGTMAQWKLGLWKVVDTYFRSPVAFIEFQVFFPPSWFDSRPQVPGGFYFPGGWLIGCVLAINLLAAHLIRFKVRVSGWRFSAGLGVLLLGVATTILVILSGSNKEGFHYSTFANWNVFWNVFLALLGIGWVAVTAYAFIVRRRETMSPTTREPLFWFLAATSLVMGLVTAWLILLQAVYPGDEAVRLNNSSMRILWQLVSATFASLVLLAGCGLLFRKRAGIVLLHGGVFLLMFGELLVGIAAVESRMTIREGETIDYIEHGRKLEFAVVDASDPEHDKVVAVPFSLLQEEGEVVQRDDLPFDIEVIGAFENSDLSPVKEGQQNLATIGLGQFRKATPKPAESGTSNRSNMASAYLKLVEKGGTRSLGTVMVSQWLLDQDIELEGKQYAVALRAARDYKPFSMYLKNVRSEEYLGTTIPMSYSSELWLADPPRSVDQPIRIWMNNPLRYGGQTFYQSGYARNPNTGVEQTTLQVVTNTGWMIPYVACMIVGTGMLAQFWVVLGRFLHRVGKQSEVETAVVEKQPKPRKRERNDEDANADGRRTSLWALLVPALVVVLFVTLTARKSQRPQVGADEMDLYTFGQLPVMYEGRVKPFDTLARSCLLEISHKASYKDDEGDRQPATRWLLEVITNPQSADDLKVFRVENIELQETLGLDARKGLRYAYSEFKEKLPEFRQQVGLASRVRRKNQDDLNPFQRRVLKFNGKLITYDLLKQGFAELPLSSMPTRTQLGSETARDEMVELLKELRVSLGRAAASELSLLDSAVPRAVPQAESGDEGPWIPYSLAQPRAHLHQEFEKMQGNQDRLPFEGYIMLFQDDRTRDFLRRERSKTRDVEPTLALTAVFDAYHEGDAWLFNRAVDSYQQLLERRSPKKFHADMLALESRFNHFQPFIWTAFTYVFVLVLVCAGWLVWESKGAQQILHRSAMWLLIAALLIHTVALIGRMVISQRPPVTNLYSSAVFIGWGAIVLGLAFEWFFRRGIGMAIAAITGFLTLMVAYYLAMRGDTIEPIRAVLDTQFWLATHVVIITAGYSATFVAGVIGAFYIVYGMATPGLTPSISKDLHRMIYGVLCFAIIFSFVGTVLGGLWGDDSWGRFWGWDPKENGALIIVLWNALVLHARFGGIVRDRGVAVLAVGGNIVTAWSWFGTNELRVGLHSYGFTEGVLMALVIFVATQFALIAAGCLPRNLWWSFRVHDEEQPAQAKLVG